MRHMPLSPFIIVPILIVAADLLLWDAVPGIGLALLLVAAGLSLIGRFPGLMRSIVGMTALTGLTLSVIAGVVDQGPLPIICAITALLSAAIIGRCAHMPDALTFLERGLPGLLRVISQPFCDARLALRWRRLHGGPPWRALGWLVPLGFGAIFAGLFIAANPVLGNQLSAMGEWLATLLTVPAPLRVMLWWLCGMSGWLLVRGRWNNRQTTSRRQPRETYDSLQINVIAKQRIDRVIRSLMVFHVLFAIQNGCDALYLWGGITLPDHMTYAEYAHRGAYPLIATALLAATFILVWFRPGSAVQTDRWCRHLVIGWLAQNLLLLGSALWRLHLYVDVYGLTRWRIAAGIWMILVGIGLALIAWRIRHHLLNRWLINANLTSLATVLLALAWTDVDGAIARHNLAHPDTATDLTYISSLGPAALPALRAAARAGNIQAGAAADRLLLQVHADLKDWRSWTLAREQWAEER